MPKPPRRYWLVKSEPESFSFDDLWRSKGRRTSWGGVRNFQARNLMRDDMHAGDGVLFYHSSAEPTGIVGLARVASAAEPDPTQFDPRSEYHDPKSPRDAPRWVAVEIEALAPLARCLTLEQLRAAPELASLLVLRRGQRLSIQPVTAAEWRAVLGLAGVRDPLG